MTAIHPRDVLDVVERLARRIKDLEGAHASAPTAYTPSGPAGGDLIGLYPNPTVAAVDGVAVSGTPSAGQALVATGGAAATWQTPAVSAIDGVVVSGTPTSGQVLTATGPSTADWQTPAGGGGSVELTPTFTYSGTLAILTGTYRWYNDTGSTRTIQQVRASVGTAPAGASIIVDVRKNGSTIFTTTANRPTITAGSQYAVAGGAPDVPTIAAGEYWTVDIVQVGSTTAGASLSVTITAS